MTNASMAAFGRAGGGNLAVRRRKRLTKSQITLLLMIIPLAVFVFIFSYVPLFGWSYAFVDFQPGVTMLQQHFVGLRYFIMIFRGGPDFWIALRNTLVLSTLSLALAPLPVIFAILISQVGSKAFSKTIQTICSLPNFLSWVIVYSICSSLLAPDDGVISKVLMSLGIIKEPLQILTNSDQAWFFQTFLGVVKCTGWGSIMYLAAIAGIDQELYNAVDVDGGGRWAKIIHIMVPGVMPTFIVLFLLAVSNVLSVGFEQFYVFQNSMTVDKLEVLDTYVYKMGIRQNQFSYGTALGMASTVVGLFILFFTNSLTRKLNDGHAIL